MARMPTALTLALIAMLAAAPAASAELTRIDKRSAASPQRIGGVSLHGRTLRFSIAYPKIGRGNGSGAVRVTVFDGPRRRRAVATFTKTVHPVAGGVERVALTLPRRARPKGLRAITIVSYHHRALPGGHGHTMAVGTVAARATRPIGRVPRAAAAAADDPLTFNVQNSSNSTIRITATPLACMNESAVAGVSALNAEIVAPGGYFLTTTIQADNAIDHFAQGSYSTGPDDAASKYAAPVIDPDYANGLYNANVRTFTFTAINKYTSDFANPPIFNAQQSELPNQVDNCKTAGHKFAVGIDQLVSDTNNNPPDVGWRAHAEAMMDLANGKTVSIQSALFPSNDDKTTSYPNTEPWIELDMSGSQTLVVNQTQGGGATPCAGGPDWMGCQFPAGSAKEQTPLYKVAVPGSHDSVTGSLASNGDWILQQNNACSHYSAVEAVEPGEVYNFAVTQRHTILDQLDMGIRYLDLRSAYTDAAGASTSSKWSSENPTWRPLHTMFAQSTVETEGQTIASWLAAHPDEIVILDYNHVCPETAPAAGTQLTGDDASTTAGLTDALQAPDPVTGQSICDRAYILPSGTSPNALPTTTIQQIRASGRNAIVLLDGSQSYLSSVVSKCGFYPLWDQTANNGAGSQANSVPINHLFPDVDGTASCESSVTDQAQYAEQIHSYPLTSSSSNIGTAATLPTFSGANPIPLTQAQTQYTVDQLGNIVEEVGCDTLLDYEKDYTSNYRNPVIGDTGYDKTVNTGDFVQWPATDQTPAGTSWASDLNIVIGDDADSNYIQTVAQINGSR